ncbi:MAG: cytochrome c biogenesis protein CcsA [Planctomycetes bacterium]|nr:cytochrome c biogenesis protein CcsA [Planctomycetota bacterium]MCB9918647.1 cytochrome c biogenesis protein CcsA [Planctomycetota bacterium]
MKLLSLFGVVACAVLFQVHARAQSPSRSPWPADVVRTIEDVPLQDEGRIKPFLAFARQKLLRISGRSSVALENGTSVSASEWVLDVLFRNEVTRDDRVFLVPSKEVLDAIELPHEGRKMRDRYSYNELAPAVSKLYELTERYIGMSKGGSKNLPLVPGQIVALGNDVWLYQQLGVEFARLARTFPVEEAGLLALFGGKSADAAAVCKHGPELNRRLAKELQTIPDTEATPLRKFLLDVVQSARRGAYGLALFPPRDAKETAWLDASSLLDASVKGDEQAAARAPLLGVLEKFLAGPEGVTVADATMLTSAIADAAHDRDEAGAVATELTLERGYFLHWIRGLFLIAIALVGFLWWKPQAKWYGRIVYGVTLVPVLLMAAVIVMRCMIRYHDPSTDILAPVTNLYETIPFITVIGAAVLLFVEFFSKNRIGLTLAILLGFAGSQLALSYEPLDGGDTLAPLQAVLVSNFWLLTHVQTVTVGYAASLLAALLAHVWIGRRLWLHFQGSRAPSADRFLKSVMRMCYGAVAFGLVFSTVGTILGGIWANYSWGRFWGWDPKENGALMICLWQAMMLHSRMAGFVRHLGFSMLAIILGMITAFSWWHVNQLGVGLHSYGFTDGVLSTLYTFYGIEGGVLLGCLVGKGLAAHSVKQPVHDVGGGEAVVKAQDRVD